MLSQIHIENYALIQHTEITLSNGFTAITGETGAGKSILLGALGMLLGQRADTQVLFDKTRKCVVEATFDITGLDLEPFFSENDLDYDTAVIIRREILPNGKTRSFLNDTPVSLSVLKELAPHLIDIHSQHQTLILADSGFQTSLLDAVGHEPSIKEEYQEAFRHYTSLKQQLEQLTTEEAESRKNHDYQQFLFEELQSANLQADEQQTLEEEITLLSHTETIKDALCTTLNCCDNEENGVLHNLRSSKNKLSHITAFHPGIEPLLSRLDSSFIELEDIVSELEHLNADLSFSPEQLENDSARLDTIYRLEKKHNVSSVEELLAIQTSLKEQIARFESLGDEINQRMEEVDKAFATLQAKAEALTRSRKNAAEKIVPQLTPSLTALGMPDAVLVVDIKESESFTLAGHDSITFLFNANRGGTPSDIARVASGGELSRLMLAIKAFVCKHTMLPTILFDEIDTGVSGNIAVAMAKLMQEMAQKMQVIAITHLPQMAAKASEHLKVYKEVNETIDTTISHIRPLTPDERVTEIATMLSKEPPTQTALETARELINQGI